jgi:uncharacterized protein (TIGR02246 family)
MKRFVFALPLLAYGLVLTPPATAGPKEDVAAATARWGHILEQQDHDKITTLYAKDGVLWGIFSPTLRSGPEAIRAYFIGTFGALPQIKVSFGDQLIRVYGNTAINTGYYTIFYTTDGVVKSIPARYSFTYVKEGDEWLIADHHSSAMPPTTR